jgi:SWI/SNF-related matrix-associated actin-dependent regulator 1 of chromatin subfamily A
MVTLAELRSSNFKTTTTPIAPSTTTTRLPVPSLALPMMDFQVEATEYALSRTASYLGLEMGLGKTVIGIAVAVAELINNPSQRILVACPPGLALNWQREFEKFAPWVATEVLTGQTPYMPSNSSVLIIGNSVIAYWHTFLTGKIDTLIIDEAHKYKNRPSGKSTYSQVRAMHELAAAINGRKVLMSGTPMPNGRTTEMPTQFDILGPDAWKAVGGPGRFWNEFAPKKNQYSRSTTAAEGVDLAKFGQLMRDSFMLVKHRNEVIELPNKGRKALAIRAAGRAAKDYLDIERDLISWLRSKDIDPKGAQRNEALIKLGYLRRAAGKAKVEGIIEYATDYLEDNPDKGLFIIAENVDVMNDLSNGLRKYKVSSVRGGMTKPHVMEHIDAFNSGTHRVLVGQITAVGTGYTLHGNGRNHHAIVAQLPWGPADLRQAEDRLHRIGQTNDVTIDIALCHMENKWTVDERLWGLIEAKAFDTSVIMTGEGDYLLEAAQDSLIESYR